ncbi:MAG: hypothetical protein LBR36_02620 [Bacteroidales bacterium]|nr:hypothetical protein [Bacteroidales bacterium]
MVVYQKFITAVIGDNRLHKDAAQTMGRIPCKNTKTEVPNSKRNLKILVVIGFVAIFLSTSNHLQAQTSFSCNYREYCTWNEVLETFDNCKGYEENSLFVMNKEATMFIHTTETIKSAYYVTSSEYDEENDFWWLYVTSDVGNKYIYIFDTKNKEIKVLYSEEGKSMLIIFNVKAIF